MAVAPDHSPGYLLTLPSHSEGHAQWTNTELASALFVAIYTTTARVVCHVSNAEVRRTTGCSPLSHLVTNRRLRLFGRIASSLPRRTTIEPLQRVSDKYRPTGSDQQEDLAILGSVLLRLTLAL